MARLTSRTIDLRRVVITGMGTLNPLGNDVATSWGARRDSSAHSRVDASDANHASTVTACVALTG